MNVYNQRIQSNERLNSLESEGVILEVIIEVVLLPTLLSILLIDSCIKNLFVRHLISENIVYFVEKYAKILI